MKNDDCVRSPNIYVYKLTDPRVDNLIKVGYTTNKSVESRVRNQFGSRGSIHPIPYELLHYERAVTVKGEEFMDHDVHFELNNRGIERIESVGGGYSEFFDTDLETVIDTIRHIKKNGVEKNYSIKEAEAIVINNNYLEVPLTAEDKRNLCKHLNIVNVNGRVYMWPKISELISNSGYKISHRTATFEGKRKRVSFIKSIN